MTTEGASFLFGGTHFDRKRFAADFALFQVKKKEETNEANKPEAAESEPEEEEEAVEKQVKKRKRKSDASSEAGDGISLFKKSKSVKADKKEKEKPANERAKEKKKLNKQLERDSLLRKKHNVHVSGTNIPSPLESFSELKSRFGCEEYLLRNLVELGFEEPTPIQRQAIPILLYGRECFACAPTGSGKTFAFVVPMLMKLKHASKDGVRAVILCPTRELAAQTVRECKKLSEGNKFNIKCMTKELVKKADFSKHPCDVLISTPRRLQMLINKKRLDLSRVEYLVLDESDKLFELGLLKQIDSVVKECSNPSIVRSLFSATLPDFVEELARTIMHDSVRVIIGRKNTASETIKQKLVYAGSEQGKFMALRQTFTESLNPPVLVFVQNKERVKELYGELLGEKIRVGAIHSDMSQSERDDAVDDFRAGKTWVLIATDVIARGMDFKGINCVINYDFPESSSAYIHRIGRCGRAGRSGEAITFYTDEDIPFLRNIANVMVSSGCEVPSWILVLPKKKWRKHRPGRGGSVLAGPKEEGKRKWIKKKGKKSQTKNLDVESKDDQDD